jgi:hypothetical protein
VLHHQTPYSKQSLSLPPQSVSMSLRPMPSDEQSPFLLIRLA